MWNLLFRLSSSALAVTAVIFISIPAVFGSKKIFSLLCAIFGLICIVSMYFEKKPGHTEEIHAVNQELRHYDVDEADHH